MQRVIGFAMIFIGIGIMIGIWFEKDWVGLCISGGLLCFGLRLFCK